MMPKPEALTEMVIFTALSERECEHALDYVAKHIGMPWQNVYPWIRTGLLMGVPLWRFVAMFTARRSSLPALPAGEGAGPS